MNKNTNTEFCKVKHYQKFSINNINNNNKIKVMLLKRHFPNDNNLDLETRGNFPERFSLEVFKNPIENTVLPIQNKLKLNLVANSLSTNNQINHILVAKAGYVESCKKRRGFSLSKKRYSHPLCEKAHMFINQSKKDTKVKSKKNRAQKSLEDKLFKNSIKATSNSNSTSYNSPPPSRSNSSLSNSDMKKVHGKFFYSFRKLNFTNSSKQSSCDSIDKLKFNYNKAHQNDLMQHNSRKKIIIRFRTFDHSDPNPNMSHKLSEEENAEIIVRSHMLFENHTDKNE
jgi:hypothetical protein